MKGLVARTTHQDFVRVGSQTHRAGATRLLVCGSSGRSGSSAGACVSRASRSRRRHEVLVGEKER